MTMEEWLMPTMRVPNRSSEIRVLITFEFKKLNIITQKSHQHFYVTDREGMFDIIADYAARKANDDR